MNRLVLPSSVKVDQRKTAIEDFVISYIERIIKFDAQIGRDNGNIFPIVSNEIGLNVDKFRNQGFRIFRGSGNIFFLKIESKISGYEAVCIQMRGLAQRMFTLKEKLQ